MNLEDARRAYRDDPVYHCVVDCIVQWILDANVTPHEARTAAMLASMIVEETRPPFHFSWVTRHHAPTAAQKNVAP